MKKFTIGLIVGVLLTFSAVALADNLSLRLIVNGEDITQEARPIIIDGRTLVPARALAEKLGASVEWDGENNAVIVTGKHHISGEPKKLDPISQNSDKEGADTVFLKVNGVNTGINWWLFENGDLFVPGRIILEFVAAKYSDINSSLTADGDLTVNGNLYKIETTISNNFSLCSLNSVRSHGLISYSWNAANTSLTLK